MLEGLFRNVTETEKNSAVEAVIQHATPRQDFFFMLVLSVGMAAFGILLDSSIILIGSMLIAPLLYPLLSLSLGVIVADHKLIGRSVYTIMKSIIFALISGAVIGLLFTTHTAVNVPFGIAGSAPSVMYTLVAAIAGLAAAFAVIKPHLNDTLPGVAISVSLVPPLASAGLAISVADWTVFSDSMMLFIVNIIGIVFSAMIVFALFKFAVKGAVAERVVKQEEKVIRKESAA